MKKTVIAFVLALGLHFTSNAQQLAEKDVPANIKTAINKKTGGHKITMYVKDPKRGKYIGNIISNNIFMNVEVDMQGNWLRTSEAFLPEKVPAPVMAALKKEYLDNGFKGSNYTLINDSKKGKYFIADVSSEDEDFKITLDTSGKILSKENR